MRWAAIGSSLAMSVTILVAATSPSAAAPAGASTITAGTDHTCALDSAGQAYCWGRNNFGQLGDSSTEDRSIPEPVRGSPTLSSIDAGSGFTCGLTSVGAAWCWGSNDAGRLGDGTTVGSNVPVAVSGNHVFTRIATGGSFACAIEVGGSAWCWGANGDGMLGNGTTSQASTPVPVSGGLTFSSIATGIDFACGVAAGLAYCWGNNSAGKLGDGTLTRRTSPVAVTGGMTSVSEVSSGYNHACMRAQATVYCWGDNGQGRLGNGTEISSATPVAVDGGISFESIDAGIGDHTCGIASNSNTYCWGRNADGQLGDGSRTNRMTPRLVSGGTTWHRVSLGYKHSCGVSLGGVVKCWGSNDQGRLGNDSTVGAQIPTVSLLVYERQGTNVTTTVDPFLVLATSGSSGSCNGVTTTPRTSSSGTSVSFGSISTAPGVGVQDLRVDTNAGSGFQVTIRSTGPFATSNGRSLSDVPGTNAIPAPFPSLTTEAFGYTTSETRFNNGDTLWARLTTSDDPISESTNPVSNHATCIAFGAATSPMTPAGSYGTSIVYTASARF